MTQADPQPPAAPRYESRATDMLQYRAPGARMPERESVYVLKGIAALLVAMAGVVVITIFAALVGKALGLI